MRISDWSSDVCSSDLLRARLDADRDVGDGVLGRRIFWRAVCDVEEALALLVHPQADRIVIGGVGVPHLLEQAGLLVCRRLVDEVIELVDQHGAHAALSSEEQTYELQ